MNEPNTDNSNIGLFDKEQNVIGIIMPEDGLFSLFDHQCKYFGSWPTQNEAVQESQKYIKWTKARTEHVQAPFEEMMSFCNEMTFIEE